MSCLVLFFSVYFAKGGNISILCIIIYIYKYSVIIIYILQVLLWH